jgi:tRNA threonylcarbamoyladenosine biosynthesis protein TsaE
VLELVSRTTERTLEIGAQLSQVLRPGDVVSLGGELGAGKTCLAQGIARGLGVSVPVTSPTFVIIREYEGSPPLVHLDVYRLERLGELMDLGAEEVFRPDAVAVVEWGDHVESLLPKSHLRVDLRYHPEGRHLHFELRGGWVGRLRLLSQAVAEPGGTVIAPGPEDGPGGHGMGPEGGPGGHGMGPEGGPGGERGPGPGG